MCAYILFFQIVYEHLSRILGMTTRDYRLMCATATTTTHANDDDDDERDASSKETIKHRTRRGNNASINCGFYTPQTRPHYNPFHAKSELQATNIKFGIKADVQYMRDLLAPESFITDLQHLQYFFTKKRNILVVKPRNSPLRCCFVFFANYINFRCLWLCL